MVAEAADFYAGKTVTIVTSTGAGGTYDIAARTVARHMPKYLPGTPTMVVQNMPGGGHMLASNYIYNIAPKDGTTIATVNQSVPAHQVLDGRGVRYDATKFNWLGALGDRNQVFVVWHTTGIKNFEDLKAKGVTAGSTGEGSSGYRYPTAINNVLGTHIKIVKGYKAAGDVELAMLRGEVSAQAHSYTAFSTAHPDWIKEGKIVFIMQIGFTRDKDLPDVPLWSELAQTPEQKQELSLIASPIPLGRPFLAPPGLPDDRVALLRKAFAATLKDPEFVKDAKKQDLDVVPMTGEEVAEIVGQTINTPPNIVAKAKAAMGN
jgi:tripartite-type tricarboxylate transporter receptor subunit TctC